jgi:hypothetical protein
MTEGVGSAPRASSAPSGRAENRTAETCGPGPRRMLICFRHNPRRTNVSPAFWCAPATRRAQPPAHSKNRNSTSPHTISHEKSSQARTKARLYRGMFFHNRIRPVPSRFRRRNSRRAAPRLLLRTKHPKCPRMSHNAPFPPTRRHFVVSPRPRARSVLPRCDATKSNDLLQLARRAAAPLTQTAPPGPPVRTPVPARRRRSGTAPRRPRATTRGPAN